MSNNAIEATNLKKYFGRTKAVDDISFSIDQGELFGFLGPNGAGKTTTIRCLMDFIRPDSGTIKILGRDSIIEAPHLKAHIGYVSSDARLYKNWTGEDHISFQSRINRKQDGVAELMDRLNFNPRKKVKHLSTGNKQKLCLILALMNNPEILILDEPTAGLDPLVQNIFYDIIRQRSENGTTVFMSSHNMAEVERVCNRVGIIRDGKIVEINSIHELTKKQIYTVNVFFDGAFDVNLLRSDNVTVIKEMEDGVVLNVKEDPDLLIKSLSQFNIRDIEILHATLEQIFLEFYR